VNVIHNNFEIGIINSVENHHLSINMVIFFAKILKINKNVMVILFKMQDFNVDNPKLGNNLDQHLNF